MIALVVHELAHGDQLKQNARRPPAALLAWVGPPATTLVTPSTKPWSSTEAEVPDVSRRRQPRLPRKANT
jgi:hypothetical protein